MDGPTILEAIILGIVQGITEFLPISSSGHLVIFGELLERLSPSPAAADGEKLALNVALHAGTLLSILVVYRRDLCELMCSPRLCLAIFVATLPAGLLGLWLKDWFETVFQTPLVAGCGLYVTGAFLLAAHKWERNRDGLEHMPLARALVIGLFQACALVPGISRSGSTIAGGLLTGLRRDAATTFSFFIAIPVIGGAALLTALDLLKAPAPDQSLAAMGVGMLVSFAVGVVSLRWLIRLISQRRLHWFAAYCFIVATITVTWQLWE